MTIIEKINPKLLIVLLVLIGIFVNSCKKSDYINDPLVIREKDNAVTVWGQSTNGRWIPYLLDRAKSENEGSDLKDVIHEFSSYLRIINDVKSQFKKKLITDLNIDLNEQPSVLDSLYRVNYSHINSSLKDKETMDKLWNEYLSISTVGFNSSKGNRNKKALGHRMSNDIPEIEVNACAVKEVFDQYFVDIRIIPTIHDTPLDILLSMTDVSLNGCANATLAHIGLVLGNVYSLQNPSASECSIYGTQIQDLLMQYLSCPTYDPTTPGYGGGTGGGTGGGGGTPAPSPTDPYPPTDPSNPLWQEINAHTYDSPFALFGDLDCFIVREWLATISHEVEQSQINKLNSIRMSTTQTPWITSEVIAKVQDINSAHSAIVNLDYFPVRVTSLPFINGQRSSPSQFIEYIRKNINNFVDTDKSEFTPYNFLGINDDVLWNSNTPLNSVVGIDIPGFFGPGDQVFDDDGAVIVSKHGADGWTFTTIFDPIDGTHPVSGNRDFGYVQNPDASFTFFTRGADRLTYAFASLLQSVTQKPFNDADALWMSFQEGINNFVNSNGGASTIDNPVIKRPDWKLIKDVLDGVLPLSTLSSDCN